MIHRWLCLVLCGVSLAGAPLRAGAQDKELTVPKEGLSHTGEVKRTDDPVKVVHPNPQIKPLSVPAQVYRVRLSTKQNYRIDMLAEDQTRLDAFLVVQDSEGKQLAFDDDSGGGLDALLWLSPPRDGGYRVFAAALQGQGRYTLRIAADGPARAALTPAQQKMLQEARALNEEGVRLYRQGKLPEATEWARKALALYQQVYTNDSYPQGHPDLAQTLNNLGTFQGAQGEYGRAESFCKQALEMLQGLYPKEKYPQGHPGLAHSLGNLGVLLQWQGEYGRAETFLRQALEMERGLYPKEKYPQGHPELAKTLNNLGTLLSAQGEHARAETFYQQVLEMRQSLYPREKYPQGHPELARSLNNLGFLLRAQREYGQARTFFKQALEMYQVLHPKEKYPQGHPDLALSLNNLGTLFMDQGEYGKAESFFQQALEMRQGLYSKAQYPQGHPDLAISLNNLGVLLMDQGQYGKAEMYCRQALDMFTQQANRLARVAPEPVALNTAATFPLTRDVLLSVTRHLPDSADRTYAAMWHSRASLTRVYQRRHLALIAAADPTVRQEWDRLQGLRRQREQLIMAPAIKDSAERTRRLQELNAAIDRAEQQLLPRLPALKHFEELDKLNPDALQKLLPQDTVLVDFLRYQHFEQDPNQPGKKGQKHVRYLAFVVGGKKIQRVELGEAKAIEAAVTAWREAITLKLPAGNEAARRDHEAKLTRLGVALRQYIWDPVHKALPQGTRTVFMSPDAGLTSVPWAALPLDGKDRVLLDEFALAIVPHGPFLLEQLTPPPPRSDKRPPAPTELLLVGGIRYDDRPAEVVAAERSAEGVVGQKVVWDYLKGTEQERELLAKVLNRSGPKLLANVGGADAATARLRQELERCRYAHIGTHGFFADKTFRSMLQLDPKDFDRVEYRIGDSLFVGRRSGEGARSPLVLSGLVCAGANLPETPERGILSADAIVGLLLDDLHLAVLSACDTGLGDVAGGEGVFGLQRAFHIAGTKNVVASLWKVDDAATAALMTRFYGHLFAEDKDKRLTPIEALRRAQLDLYRHPELIPAWSKGESRAPGKPRPATTPAPPETPPELVTTMGRAPVRLWAAFSLSGLGR